MLTPHSVEYDDSWAKIFLVLYSLFENSTIAIFCTTGRSSRFCLRRLKKRMLVPKQYGNSCQLTRTTFSLIWASWNTKKDNALRWVLTDIRPVDFTKSYFDWNCDSILIKENLYHQIIIKSRKERTLEFVNRT